MVAAGLLSRAIEAARLRGLDTEPLEFCVDRYGFDSGAARGCLLALVREAWGDPNASCGVIGLSRKGTYVWSVCGEDSPICMEATEAEALVAALEAAP